MSKCICPKCKSNKITDDKDLFKSLLLHKSEIENEIGFALDWRELPERKCFNWD